ncbi:MAG: dimethylsulfonioproprionate lyase family protein [Rhizobiaceae bacterium]
MSIKGLFADYRDYLTMREEEEVRDFVGDIDWFVSQRNLAPVTVSGAKHLEGLDAFAEGHEKRLVQSLMNEIGELFWGRSYTADDFGAEFFENYGYVEMMGERGHFDSSERAGGFFLMGPNQNYPSHRHVAEELYIPLTGGTLWMRDNGEYVEQSAGTVIVHESNETHAMRTLDKPLLALWMWRDGDLTQKSEY